MYEELLDKHLRKNYAVSFYDLSVDVQNELMTKVERSYISDFDGAADHFIQLYIGLHKLGFWNMLITYWNMHQEFKRLQKEAFKEKK